MAPRRAHTVAVSSSSATGSEARSAQSRAAAIFSGGLVSRVAGLNAQANSACRSTFGAGEPGSLAVSAMVTVTSASATDRRETGARFGHLASVYARAWAYQVIISSSVVSAPGRPVRGLKGRRSRTASFRSVRNPSARGRALNDLQCSRPSAAHRTR
jgi:hypothetical protein